jgi:LacI family transcriptional regulator
MSATIRDVARKAHVSQATAARALGGYGYVSIDARQRVLVAANELDYLANNAARTLASGNSNIIGFIASDIENPFFATAARGLADVVEEFGYTLIVANSDEDASRERLAVDSLRGNRVDGLVVAPSSSRDAVHLSEASSAGIPVVLVDRTVRGLSVDSVTSDGAAGTTTAIEHLLSLGHRRIAIVIDDAAPPLSSMSMRLHGWRDTLKAAGIEPEESLISPVDSRAEGAYKATLDLLNRPRPPTAVFTASNVMTVGALRAIRELGLRLPRDLSLVAFDDSELLSLYEPPITVVAQPVRQLGAEAGRLLIARMQGDTGKPRRLRLPTQFVLRNSTSPLRS